MTLIAADRLSKRFNDQVILEQVSFSIVAGERIGLVGRNGSGKTTLFELIAGMQEVDSGTVTRPKGCHIDYIEQEKSDYHDLTLFEYVASAREDLLQIRRDITRLEAVLAENPDDRNSLTRLGSLQSQFEHEGGFTFENEIKTILTGLSFDEERYRDRMINFSGGEKNRAGLARALAGKGNLLLLDEPTNHLDIDSTLWLEEFLNKTNKSFLVVSHDRTFLGNTVDKVWEITRGKIDVYHGKFEKYLSERAERLRLHEHHYRHQQDEIKRIEDFIRRNMAGQKTKQAQSKLKYLARIKRLPPPPTEGASVAINLSSSGRSYAHVLEVENVTVGYGHREVASCVDFDIYRGDRVGLIGANGSGKSTILKSLIGELTPIEGDIQLGNKVNVAYFDQELSNLMLERTVLENLWEVDPMAESGTIRSFLGRFGFSGDDCFKLVSSLSGGEKTKLSLARLLYHPANFLIFDEPTNHLDLDSREALEQALREYDGSYLVVSHDRYFLDAVVDKILHIHDGRLKTYLGNYSYFREKSVLPPPLKQKNSESTSKQSWLDFKEQSKRRSRHKKEVSATREKIAQLEKELEAIVVQLDGNVAHADWEKLHEMTARKTALESELIDLYEKLEKLEEVDLD